MRKKFIVALCWMMATSYATQALAAPYQLLIGNRVSGPATDRILSYDGASGAPSSLNPWDPTNIGGINAAQQMAGRPDGTLYVVSQDTQQVKRYNQDTGAFISTVVTTTANGGTDPTGLAFDPAGNMYVSHFSTRNVLRYTSAGTFIDQFIAPVGASGPGFGYSLFGPDGNYYINHLGTSSIRKYSAAGALLDASWMTGISSGSAVVLGPDGRIYAQTPGTIVSRDLVVSGTSTFTLSGGPAFTDLAQIAFGMTDKNLYLLDNDLDRVLRYQGPLGGTPGAFIDTFVTTGSGGLVRGIGMTFIPEPSIGLTLAALPLLLTRRR